jgi:EAL domain-containing protein (putative c-di-GMP-specific phosphodiesterase class I)
MPGSGAGLWCRDGSESEEAVCSAADPLAAMRRVVEQALVAVPAAQGAAVGLAVSGVVTQMWASGMLLPAIGTRLNLEGGLSGVAVRTGCTLRCDDTALDERVDQQACQLVGAVSLVCVPLLRRESVVGVLVLASRRKQAFDCDTVALLSRLARFISDAIAGWAELANSAAAVLEQQHGGKDPARAADQPNEPDRSLLDRAAQFVANVMEPGAVEDRLVRRRIEAVLAGRRIGMEFQPIVDLKTSRAAGYEALSRFPGLPAQAPDLWFAEAHRVGLGAELQLLAVEKALTLMPVLPKHLYLAVNVGHDTATDPRLLQLLQRTDSARVVIELTEHLHVQDYPSLIDAVRRIRETGARLAIDDTGAGFAGLSHILKLAPDLIKLDRVLTTGIDTDPARQALAGALVHFACATDAKVIAEGIQTAGELHTVHQLGVHYGQGYLLGRPQPLRHLMDFDPVRTSPHP